MSIELTVEQQRFVDTQISAGVYQNSSEVIQTAIELLKNRHDEHSQLQEAIKEAERGEYDQLDMQEIKREMNAQLDQKNVKF